MRILQNRVFTRLSVLFGSLCACAVMMTGQLFAGDMPRGARVRIDPLGNMVAVWELDQGDKTIIQAATRIFSSGTWNAPQQLSLKDISAVNLDSRGPMLVVNSSGETVAVWVSFDTAFGINRLYAATIELQDPSPAWTTAVAVSSTNETVLDDFSLGLNENSQAVLIWLANIITPAGWRVNSAVSTVSPGTNTWSAPVQASGP